MANCVHCDIVSVKEAIYSGSVQMIIAHGRAGDIGVLAGHAPLLTQLKPGPVRVIKENGEEEVFYVSGGILEVQPNKITVLADTAIRGNDLDEARALEAKARAEENLKDNASDVDYARAQAELSVAVAQLAALAKLRKKQ